MGYTPENNPYIPGDPYSYDLAWMVQEVKKAQAVGAEAEGYKDAAEAAKDTAISRALDSEAWATGTKDGDPVTADDPQYENNAKYYAQEAASDAEAADLSATQAANSSADAQYYAEHIADPVSGIVTAWMDDNITQPTTPVVDASLTVAGAAADAKVTGDKIRDLSGSTRNMYTAGDKSFTKDTGYFEFGGTMYPGQTYTLTADVASNDTDRTQCRIYLISAADVQQNTPSILIDRGIQKHVTFTVNPASPNITKLIFYASNTAALSTGDTASFENVMITEGSKIYDYIPPVTAVDYEARESILNVLNKNIDAIPLALEESDFSNGGIGEAGQDISRPKRIRSDVYYPCSGYGSINISVSTYYLDVCFYAADQSTVIGRIPYIQGSKTFPMLPGAVYMRVTMYSDDDNVTVSTTEYTDILISFGRSLLSQAPEVIRKTKFLALGDSITVGKCSSIIGTSAGYGWAAQLANAFGYEFSNQGHSGMGYVAVGDNAVTLSDALDTIEALPDDYDLIAIMLGINDYNSSSITITQITSALESCISRLSTRFPEARIVVITPLNACNRGSSSTMFDYNHTHGGRTLKQIADAIKSTCDSKSIECIYASNSFLFNANNIQDLQPDTVHPSQEAHSLIAKSLAHYLYF